MRIFTFTLIFSLIVSTEVIAQSIDISLVSQLTIGGDNFDAATNILKLSDGGYLVGGISDSNISGEKTDSCRGDFDYWVIKLDAQFNEVWQRTFGGDSLDGLNSMLQTSDGNILVGGTSRSQTSGDKTAQSKGITDMWVIKIDANGNEIWQKTYGGDSHEKLRDIVELANGRLLFSGHSDSEISGDKTAQPKGSIDYWLVVTDSIGNVLFDKCYGGDDVDAINDASLLPNGNILLTGNTTSPLSGDKTEELYGYINIWLVCLDSTNWSVVWDKTIGGNTFDIKARTEVLDNRIYTAVISQSDSGGTKSENSRGDSDYWITCLDINGNVMWDKTIGGVAKEEGIAITKTSSGNLLIGGISRSNSSFEKEENSKGDYDLWPVCIDTNGNIKWQKTIGGSLSDGMQAVLEISPSNYILCGNSESTISGDKTDISRGWFDYWIVEVSSSVGISETGTLELTMFPNPAFEELRISIPASVDENYTLLLSDNNGKVIINQALRGGSNEINLGDLSQGVYTVSVLDEILNIASRKIVKLNR